MNVRGHRTSRTSRTSAAVQARGERAQRGVQPAGREPGGPLLQPGQLLRVGAEPAQHRGDVGGSTADHPETRGRRHAGTGPAVAGHRGGEQHRAPGGERLARDHPARGGEHDVGRGDQRGHPVGPPERDQTGCGQAAAAQPRTQPLVASAQHDRAHVVARSEHRVHHGLQTAEPEGSPRDQHQQVRALQAARGTGGGPVGGPEPGVDRGRRHAHVGPWLDRPGPLSGGGQQRPGLVDARPHPERVHRDVGDDRDRPRAEPSPSAQPGETAGGHRVGRDDQVRALGGHQRREGATEPGGGDRLADDGERRAPREQAVADPVQPGSAAHRERPRGGQEAVPPRRGRTLDLTDGGAGPQRPHAGGQHPGGRHVALPDRRGQHQHAPRCPARHPPSLGPVDRSRRGAGRAGQEAGAGCAGGAAGPRAARRPDGGNGSVR